MHALFYIFILYRPSADWCGCSPITLLLPKDLKFIESIKKFKEFFGRKFDSTIHIGIINHIDKYIYGIEIPNKYWHNIWHKK